MIIKVLMLKKPLVTLTIPPPLTHPFFVVKQILSSCAMVVYEIQRIIEYGTSYFTNYSFHSMNYSRSQLKPLAIFSCCGTDKRLNRKIFSQFTNNQAATELAGLIIACFDEFIKCIKASNDVLSIAYSFTILSTILT